MARGPRGGSVLRGAEAAAVAAHRAHSRSRGGGGPPGPGDCTAPHGRARDDEHVLPPSLSLSFSIALARSRLASRRADLSRRDATVVRRLAGLARDHSRRDARRVSKTHNRQPLAHPRARRPAERGSVCSCRNARANGAGRRLPHSKRRSSSRGCLGGSGSRLRARSRIRSFDNAHCVALRCAASRASTDHGRYHLRRDKCAITITT